MCSYTISVIIPTLNSAKTLPFCLDSIIAQEYPKEKIEVIIADGGSCDGTLEIINSKLTTYQYKILSNPLRTGEAGKAVALRAAKNDVIALIDSDNILPQKDWFVRMVEPLVNDEILASEPLEYTYRQGDSLITRYCALLGMNDPLCLSLGNYDRYCNITKKWTEISHKEIDRDNYLEITFSKSKRVPTIGANGFLVRRSLLQKYQIGDYLFDMDIIYNLLIDSALGNINSEYTLKIAKVKLGIVHLFSGTSRSFARKQIRRIRDYYYYKSLGLRKYPWDKIKKWKILKFIFNTVFLCPLFIQIFKGYSNKKDTAWFYHLIACWLTLVSYTIGAVRGLINVQPHNRANWKQG